MPSQPDAGSGEDRFKTPRAEGILAYLRRRWLSQGRHPALEFWLLFRGIPLLVLYASLFALNGGLIGWREAYDVSVAITSPTDTDHPFPAWLLSVAGWLVAPGIAGAVAGYVISASIASRRRTSVAQLFDEDSDG